MREINEKFFTLRRELTEVNRYVSRVSNYEINSNSPFKSKYVLHGGTVFRKTEITFLIRNYEMVFATHFSLQYVMRVRHMRNHH